MKKKMLSAVLALCLLFGSASALPQSAVVESTSIVASAETTATSGKCGENVSWSLKNGVLTISGTGDMYGALHYGDTYNSMPFFKNKSIKSVVVKTGVTWICDHAFYGCTNLTSVSIPGTVEYIGSFAFADCSKLKKLTIENGFVRGIGTYSATHSSPRIETLRNFATDLGLISNNIPTPEGEELLKKLKYD